MDFRKIRFIHEASKLGPLHVVLFDDDLIEKTTGTGPKFPLSERLYFVKNIRYVEQVYTIDSLNQLRDIKTLTGCYPGWLDFIAVR